MPARSLKVAFLLVLTILIIGIFWSYERADSGGLLKVVFLDVGQGDAIFIESPSGRQILIDGGGTEVVQRQLRKHLGFFDRDLDMVVATHPDQDHIGGLVSVLKRYRVQSILLTENKNDTPVADMFLKGVQGEGATIHYARAGQVYDLGVGERGSTTLRILFPDYDPTELESNTSSIIAKLTYGSIDFMLTGDSPIAIEEYLVEQGIPLQSEVLKAGHHGSRTSSSAEFVAAVAPQFAVISSGKDNRYGHPHKEVTKVLTDAGVAIKNTALLGSISFESDGVTFWAR